MAKEVEREIKLLIDKKYRLKLWNMPLLKEALKPESMETAKLFSTYYDTKDYKLAQAGMAYRIRKNGKSYEATVKTMGNTVGGFSSRQEYTTQLTKKKVVLSGFAPGFDEKLQTLTTDDELQKLFEVVINRKICLLQITPDTLVEMALDEGEVLAEGTSEPIYEVELEIKKGHSQDLFAFVAALAQKVPILVEDRSKFKRGLDLLTGSGSKNVVNSQLPYLNKDENAADEIKKVFYHYIDKVLVGQNIVFQKATLPEADAILLPGWEELQALWNFVEPLVPAKEFITYKEEFKERMEPLQKLAQIHRWREAWQEINALNAIGSKGGFLDKALRAKEKEALRNINRNIHNGHYSYFCFKLLAYLTGHPWQKAALLQLHQFMDYRWKTLLEKIQTGKLDENLCLFAQGFVTLGGLVKTAKLTKANYKRISALTNKLTAILQNKLEEESVAQLCHSSQSKSIYREVGILQGYLLAQEKRSRKKLDKVVEKLHS